MDPQNEIHLYSPADIATMRVAEEARLPGKNRVEEIRNFARLAGIRKIGIAHCIGLQKEAQTLLQMLSPEFEVVAVDCKFGKIASADLLGNGAKGTSCNPAGQAHWLANEGTQLNISFGLCMGHDIVFNQKSVAPVTTLIVKDREHRHHPYKTFERNH